MNVNIIEKLVLSMNKLETNHQFRQFFLHKGLMKNQNLQKKICCVFLKLLYCPVGITIILVVFSILLCEIIWIN